MCIHQVRNSKILRCTCRRPFRWLLVCTYTVQNRHRTVRSPKPVRSCSFCIRRKFWNRSDFRDSGRISRRRRSFCTRKYRRNCYSSPCRNGRTDSSDSPSFPQHRRSIPERRDCKLNHRCCSNSAYIRRCASHMNRSRSCRCSQNIRTVYRSRLGYWVRHSNLQHSIRRELHSNLVYSHNWSCFHHHLPKKDKKLMVQFVW